ncbi:nucleoside deaminase [Streptomyces hyaluromycini]|uniref:nucleoside deaminase n=1 Tax=Streptomyces hyaluromycini TaxID=1377993 RepID=UPI00123805D7|nr:nucleoside deaminase [Streptomyces hyaluromycini]
MRPTRRSLLGLLGTAGLGPSVPGVVAPHSTPAAVGSAADGGAAHARFMSLAIEQAHRNARYPFGAVFVHSGRVLGRGVNASAENPSYHGEMVAMADYVRRAGNQGWAATTLYSTAEPCAMCMSACVWAGVGQVVWGTSIEELGRTGLVQIAIPAAEVARAASPFYSPELLGGVLAGTTDALFRQAQLLRTGRTRGVP